jgi:hypothetical protein
MDGTTMSNDEASAAKREVAGELREEERKIREMRCLVDVTTAVIAQGNVSVLEACALIRLTRQQVLKLFPDKEKVFDLIYRPRFARIVRERLKKSPTWMN